MNGEKLKVEGAQPQCSPQKGKGVKKWETQPLSSPHEGNVAKENREGIFFFYKVCLCLADLYAINLLFVYVKFLGAQGGALLSSLSAIVVG